MVFATTRSLLYHMIRRQEPRGVFEAVVYYGRKLSDSVQRRSLVGMMDGTLKTTFLIGVAGGTASGKVKDF